MINVYAAYNLGISLYCNYEFKDHFIIFITNMFLFQNVLNLGIPNKVFRLGDRSDFLYLYKEKEIKDGPWPVMVSDTLCPTVHILQT